MKKRILAMALTAAMMLSLFPASVFALPESQPTASSSEIVAQLNESASGDSQPAASEKPIANPPRHPKRLQALRLPAPRPQAPRPQALKPPAPRLSAPRP